ncbi:MAG: hypothetical protein FWG02_00265 [Holophagaceae bacterium]|nr:hypothetical protein [Holophagaceae bacterium]
MVWSKDLAKLKLNLKAQEGNSPPAPPVQAKPAPRPEMPKSLEEEDALFLTALGKPKAKNALFQLDSGESDEFEEAISQLKGVKPKSIKIPIQTAVKEIPSGTLEDHIAFPESVFTKKSNTAQVVWEDSLEGKYEIEFQKDPPEKIQLAAGMTIEVDGQLDLRNHNNEDALERLRERVLDGFCRGWRSLHVVLGESEQLNQVLADFINSPQSAPLAKYAQAPIPMGGAKAWIFYYEPQTK